MDCRSETPSSALSTPRMNVGLMRLIRLATWAVVFSLAFGQFHATAAPPLRLLRPSASSPAEPTQGPILRRNGGQSSSKRLEPETQVQQRRAAEESRTELRFSGQNGHLEETLSIGRRLEAQRRWAEALNHYEEAIRRFPESPSLQQRYAVARQYFDLNRRFADRSFRALIGELDFASAMEAYGAVLLKVQTFYVDEPQWRYLIDHGTFALHVALTDSAFLSRCETQSGAAEIAECIERIKRTTAAMSISSRREACDAVARAASIARRDLGVPPAMIVLEYLSGACNALDPYSAFLTPDQLQEVYGQIEGNFVGLGVELKAQDGLLNIVRVIAGSPAEQAGLRAGERIVAIDDRDLHDISADEAANLLQGPEGSSVTLSLVSGETTRRITVIRRRVEVPSIDCAEIIDPNRGIGYLRLTCFQKTTAADLDRALWNLRRQGMAQLIIDLRGNPGGLLTAAVESVDRFLQRGIIVTTRGRSPNEDFTYTARTEGTWTMPLAVLIDGNSASAAEIFAGAIRDHQRGWIIGERSFGKGSVQGIFTIDVIGAGLRLTTAKFYSPSGEPYSRRGVEPDLTVATSGTPSRSSVEPGTADVLETIGLPTAPGANYRADPAIAAAARVLIASRAENPSKTQSQRLSPLAAAGRGG